MLHYDDDYDEERGKATSDHGLVNIALSRRKPAPPAAEAAQVVPSRRKPSACRRGLRR